MRTPEQIKNYQKQWRENNKQKRADYAKVYHAAWYEENKQKKLAKNAEWQRNNPDKRKNIVKRYHIKNPEASMNSARKYKTLHPKEFNESQLRYKKTSKSYYRTYKGGAVRRGHEFLLPFEQFVQHFKSNCHYCGKPEAMGIDRVDNSLGYTQENSVPCCHFCNRMKWTHKENFFLDHILKIAKHNNMV